MQKVIVKFWKRFLIHPCFVLRSYFPHYQLGALILPHSSVQLPLTSLLQFL